MIERKLSILPPLSNAQILKIISQLKFGTHEWTRKRGSINIFTGCLNNCLYCYARCGSNRMCTENSKSFRKYDDWGEKPDIRWENVNKIYKKVKSEVGKYDFMFQTASDIFPDEPDYPYYTASLKVLNSILKVGNSVLITSKPRLEVIKALTDDLEKYQSQIAFRFTISSLNNDLIHALEPKASSVEERLLSAQIAKERGFPITFSCEPLIDETPYDLVNKLKPLLSKNNPNLDQGTIWLGLFKTKYTPKKAIENNNLRDIYNNIRKSQKFEKVYEWYEKYFDDECIKFKESVKKLMIKNNIQIKI